MLHQIYIVKQMNVCNGYSGNRGEQKHNEKNLETEDLNWT